MALDPNKVISPNLQEFFIDPRDNLPASGGTVTYYEEDGITLKPIYTLSGMPGSYSYVQLPNPLTLSGAGTTIDEDGNDVRVYYYPYDDDTNQVANYFIRAQAADGYEILVRRAWPNFQSDSEVAEYSYNFVRNHTFAAWGNITTFNNVKLGSTDQYDFFPNDWTYVNDDATQTINIERGVFQAGEDSVDENPPYYLKFDKVTSGSSQTVNSFRQYYTSAQTLNSKNVICEVWVRQRTGSGGLFSVTAIQDFGTGSSNSPNPVVIIPPQEIKVSDGWTKISATTVMPSITGKDLKTDSKLILSLNLPLNISYGFDIAPVHFREGTTRINEQELSNDDIKRNTNVITLYPPFTTGDVKTTIKTAADPGWLLMDDATIGNTGSGAAHTGWKYYPLYSLIWTNVHSTKWAPIYNSAGVEQSAYGASAAEDWNAGNRLSLIKALGRVFANTGAGTIQRSFIGVPDTDNYLTVASGTDSLYTGTPVTLSVGTGGVLPTGLSAVTTYYALQYDATTIYLYDTQAHAVAGANGSSTGLVIFTSTGTSPIYINAALTTHTLGQYLGENAHSLTIPELPAHDHSPGVTFGELTNIGGGGSNVVAAPGSNVGYFAVSSQGGNTPLNIIQPTTYINVMIKL